MSDTSSEQSETYANWKRTFLTIVAGQAVSQVGSSAVQFALIWWLAEKTSSPLILGIAGLMAFLPTALLSPLAGVVADRYDRKAVCIAADMFAGVMAVAFALVLWLVDAPMWAALVILALRGVGVAFQGPAFQAMIPQFVPAENLVQAGGWNMAVASASYILGPVLGAALYAALPLSAIMLTDLVGAVFACVFLAIAHVPALVRTPVAAEEDAPEKAGVLSEFKEGLLVFSQSPALMLVMVVDFICSTFYLPLSSFYPLMTSSYFGGSAWHGSAVEVSFAIGMLVSAALFGSVVKVRRHLLVTYLGLLGLGITSVISGLLPPTMAAWCVFAVTCGFMGAFGNVYSIPLTAYLQETIDPEKMGRAFSVLTLMASVAMPLGLAIASPLAEMTGVSSWFLIAGLGMVAASGIGLMGNVRLTKRAKEGDSVN